MSRITQVIKDEPVAVASIIRLGLLAAVSLGFGLETEQIAAIVLFVETLLTFVSRMLVTPVDKAVRTREWLVAEARVQLAHDLEKPELANEVPMDPPVPPPTPPAA